MPNKQCLVAISETIIEHTLIIAYAFSLQYFKCHLQKAPREKVSLFFVVCPVFLSNEFGRKYFSGQYGARAHHALTLDGQAWGEASESSKKQTSDQNIRKKNIKYIHTP